MRLWDELNPQSSSFRQTSRLYHNPKFRRPKRLVTKNDKHTLGITQRPICFWVSHYVCNFLTLFLSNWYLTLPVKLCVLEASPLIFLLANEAIWDELVCEILKVPLFFRRVFFILIRNSDLQRNVSEKEI